MQPPLPLVLLVLFAFAAACGTSPRGSTGEGAATDAGDLDAEPDLGPDGSPDPGTGDAMGDAGEDPADAPEDVPDLPDAPQDAAPADASADGADPDVPPAPDTSGEDVAEPPLMTPEEIAETCVSACETREAGGGAGCPLGMVDVPCSDWCTETGVEVDNVLLEAYFICVEQDPLCFQSMLQCALSLAYPEPFPHTLVVAASGFGRLVGSEITVGVQEAPDTFDPITQRIESSNFELEFDVVMGVNQSRLTLWYVDMNGNGVCDPELDVTGTGDLNLWELSQDFVRVPDWRVEITLDPERRADFVCDIL